MAVPFFMIVLATIGFGLYFFTSSSLEHGVEAAARQIRTGQAQKSDMTVGEFKELVCAEAGSTIDCSKLHVLLNHAETWSGISPQSCINPSNKSLTPSTGSSGDLLYNYTGGASEVVLVTLCYEWELASTFAFLKLGAGDNGSGAAVIQAVTAFRVEPYSSASS